MTTTAGGARRLRRRVDNWVLRWQARLDSEWADRVLPWAFAFGMFLVLVVLALAKARSLDGTIDLSVSAQAAWLLREGREPQITIVSGTNFFANQAAFAFVPIVLVTYVVPIVPTLLFVQAAALALAIVPLWRICRRLANLRVGATVAVVYVYALYPTVHNLNLDGFHTEVLAVPGLLAMFFFGLSGRWRPFALCVALVLAARADLGLAVAGFGGLLAFQGRRRAGFATIAVGVGWTVLCGIALQPALGDGTFPHMSAFAAFGDTPATALWGLLTSPGDALAAVVRRQNFELLVTLLAPVVFLPLLAPRYLVPVLPLQVFYLVADVPREAVFGQQTVAVTAFVFLATAFALSRIGRLGVEKVTVDRRVLGALVLAGSVFFVADAASSPYERPWEWGGQDAADGVRLAAADVIPEEAPVRVSPSMLPLVAEREFVELLELPADLAPRDATAGVDFVVFDARQVPDWTVAQRRAFRSGIERQGFEVVVEGQDIVLLAREGTPRRAAG